VEGCLIGKATNYLKKKKSTETEEVEKNGNICGPGPADWGFKATVGSKRLQQGGGTRERGRTGVTAQSEKHRFDLGAVGGESKRRKVVCK